MTPEIERARDKWLEAQEDPKVVWGEEYRRLSKEKLLLQQEKLLAENRFAEERWRAENKLAEERLSALRRTAPEDTEDWSSAFLYSERVKAWTGAAVPYEQWGLYASVIGGALFCGNAYSKAYHLMKAAKAAPDSEARALHKALAWVSEEQVKHAAIIASRFQRRGILAALGAPLSWLAYIQAKHSKSG